VGCCPPYAGVRNYGVLMPEHGVKRYQENKDAF